MNFARLKTIRAQKEYNILNAKAGQYLEIHEKVGDGNNTRIWKFKGLVIKVRKPGSHTGSFTIRGKSSGISLEKVYPLSFPKFDKVILLDEYKVRKSKLYYMRDKVGKDARMKSLLDKDSKGVDLIVRKEAQPAQTVESEPVVETVTTEVTE
ncbi:MAG: 50S ribosomal protein L19 [Candidatus Absconditabacteria bacterium]